MSTPLTLVYNFPVDNTTLTLPINDGGTSTGSITSINWGDGSSNSTTLETHTYVTAGSYEVQITSTGFRQ